MWSEFSLCSTNSYAGVSKDYFERNAIKLLNGIVHVKTVADNVYITVYNLQHVNEHLSNRLASSMDYPTSSVANVLTVFRLRMTSSSKYKKHIRIS